MCRAVIEANEGVFIKVSKYADIPRGSGIQSEVVIIFQDIAQIFIVLF
jgi:hypothetical protein